jgi:competence protein ComEA
MQEPETEEKSIITFLKNNFYLSLVILFGLGFASAYFLLGELGVGGCEDGFDSEISMDDDAPILSELLSEEASESWVVVDLSGAVKNPGIYKLSKGARVADLIKAGGGILSEVSGKWVSRSLNLSRVLVDTEKVYIPFEWELSSSVADAGIKSFVEEYEKKTQEVLGITGDTVNISGQKDSSSSSSSGSSDTAGDSPTQDKKINVNTASLAELKSLPGIGDVYGNRIIELRPFKDIDELKENVKIPGSTIEKIENLISF